MTETNITPALVSILLLSLVATSGPAVGAAPGSNADDVTQRSGVDAESSVVASVSGPDDTALAEGKVEETVGDRATINVTIDRGESGQLIVGSADVGYRAVIGFDDDDYDGEVSLTMNTYLAGNHTGSGESQAWSAEADDDIENVNLTTAPLDEPIEPADYELKVRDDGELRDINLLTLSEPVVSSLTFETAPGDQFGESRAEMNLTETDSVALDDVVVANVHTQGVFGILDAQPGEDDTERLRSLLQSPNASFTLERLGETPNRDRPELDVDESFEDDAFHLISDPANDTLLITMDSEALAFTSGRAKARADDRYEAEFELDEDSQVISSDEQVKSTVQFTDRTVTVGPGEEGQLSLPPSSNASVNGTTTLAPGTRLSFKVQVNETFSQSRETVVQSNRTFVVPVNLSEAMPGANVSVSAYNYEAEARGVVQDPWSEPAEPTEPTTPLDEPPIATTTEPTLTDEPTPGTTTQTTTTETTSTTTVPSTDEGVTTGTITATPAPASNDPAGTTTQATTAEGPGFDIALAALALVGFALLVTRRRPN